MKRNIEVVLEILKNEVEGDVASALQKMTADYKMTWVYQGKEEIFPTVFKSLETELKKVYPIKGREYDIRNIAENDNVVFVEVVESYPEPKTGKVFRTPLILVLELERGKIRTGRHYCDPRLSEKYLSKEEVNKTLDRTETRILIT